MAQQPIDVGSLAGDGTGDPLREAFTKINENFAELYSGNVQITAANVLVTSVAGRIGNVVLAVGDVAQAASKAYVDSSISANVTAALGSVTDSLRANITAANVVISNHSARISSLESGAVTQSSAIEALENTRATVSYVDYSIGLALSSNSVLANVQSVNANVAAANLAIAAINANLGTATNNITSLQSNAATQGNQINQINANVTAANAQITSLSSTVSGFAANISVLQSNAAAQQLQIDSVSSDFTTANSILFATDIAQQLQIDSLNLQLGNLVTPLEGNITSLQTNIAILDANVGSYQIWSNANIGNLDSRITTIDANIIAANLEISSLQANASVQSLEIDNLYSNAGAQADSLAALVSNSAAQADELAALTSNAATQSDEINLINANVTAANAAISILTANAAIQHDVLMILTANALVQSLDIDNLYSNIAQKYTDLDVTNANVAAANIAIATINSNVEITNANVDALFANVTILYDSDGLINSNVANLDLSKANLTGAIFSGNVQGTNLIANANVEVGGNITVGYPAPIDYPGKAGIFTGDVDSYYQLVIQNINNGADASGDIVITADDGTDTTNYLNIGINSSNFVGDFLDNPDLTEYPHDGYLTVLGGNVAVRTDYDVVFVANSASMVLRKDGNFILGNTSLQFSDGTIQQTAFDLNSLNANIVTANTEMKGYVDTQISSISSFGNTQVKSYLGAFNGNIIPSANLTYTLGDATNQWKEIHVGGNTIYMGGIPISTAYIDDYGSLTLGANSYIHFSSFADVPENTMHDTIAIRAGWDSGIEGSSFLFASNGAMIVSPDFRILPRYGLGSGAADSASGNITIGNLIALSNVIGNVSYTPNTASNYNGTITNIQQALDELAARIKALGG